MNAVAVALACAALSAIAAAGIVRPFGVASATRARPPRPVTRHPIPRTRLPRRVAPLAVAVVALGAVVTPFLWGALGSSAPPERADGVDSPTGASLALQRAIDRDPRDVPSRLELADAELQKGDASAATHQYLQVLAIDPDNPEAHTRLGLILLAAGRPRQALSEVDRALLSRPGDPEALFAKGVILLRGLRRPAQAAEAFRTYLRAAPFGAYRTQAKELLRESTHAARVKGAGS